MQNCAKRKIRRKDMDQYCLRIRRNPKKDLYGMMTSTSRNRVVLARIKKQDSNCTPPVRENRLTVMNRRSQGEPGKSSPAFAGGRGKDITGTSGLNRKATD